MEALPQFWKQFFESSANVSLSGYEEQPPSESEDHGTSAEDSTTITHTTLEDESESYATPSSEHIDLPHRVEALGLSSLTISPSQSTPRATRYSSQEYDDPTTSSLESSLPHETQRQVGTSTGTHFQQQKAYPITPGKGQSENMSVTPSSSPLPPPASHMKSSTARKWQKPTDPVLHRVCDKTYRIQATPLGSSRKGFSSHREAPDATPKTSKLGPKPGFGIDSSPLSSPEIEVPKLHSEIFSSPIKGETHKRFNRLSKPSTPKPGVSLLSPTRRGTSAHKTGIWDSDDDLDDDDENTALFGHSPPKTMQFHVPQSRLLKTPGMLSRKFSHSRSIQISDFQYPCLLFQHSPIVA
jgi:DASH complex subunit ASK1